MQRLCRLSKWTCRAGAADVWIAIDSGHTDPHCGGLDVRCVSADHHNGHADPCSDHMDAHN